MKASPEIKRIVKAAIDTGKWTLEDGSKHARIRHASGRMVTFAGSSSDRQSALYLKRDIKHVEKGLPGWGMCQAITANITL